MYVCMYTCTHAFVQMTCIVRLFLMQDTTDDTIPSVNNSRKPGKKTGGSGNPLPPPKKRAKVGLDTCIHVVLVMCVSYQKSILSDLYNM